MHSAKGPFRKKQLCHLLWVEILPWISRRPGHHVFLTLFRPRPYETTMLEPCFHWQINWFVIQPDFVKLLDARCPVSGCALGFGNCAVNEVPAAGHQCHHPSHMSARVCVLPNWPTWLVPHWPSYKYSYSHTILITVKGRVHIGGELYIIEKVIYLSTNLLISYWTQGVKKKFLEIESYSSANLYIRTLNHLRVAACTNMNALSGKVNTKL